MGGMKDMDGEMTGDMSREEYIITDYNQGFFPDVHAKLVPGKNIKFNKVCVVKSFVEKKLNPR